MRTLFITPLVIFLMVLMVFMAKLLDTDNIAPSPLIGKPLPQFNLPPVYEGGANLNSEELKGKYFLLNIFASWCLTCRIEHPLLMKIKEQGTIPVYGIDWKDKKENVLVWLKTHGDPYTAIGADMSGKTAIDLGITGAPETFLISPDGIVLYRYAGPLTEDVVEGEIKSFIMDKAQ